MTVTCGAKLFQCRCVKAEGHLETDEVHACDAGCGGSWTGVEGGGVEGVDFTPVTYPSGVLTGLPREAAAAPTDDDEHVFLMAVVVTGGSRTEAMDYLYSVMPKTGEDDSTPFVDSWWHAEPDRRDRSDNDNAQFLGDGA